MTRSLKDTVNLAFEETFDDGCRIRLEVDAKGYTAGDFTADQALHLWRAINPPKWHIPTDEDREVKTIDRVKTTIAWLDMQIENAEKNKNYSALNPEAKPLETAHTEGWLDLAKLMRSKLWECLPVEEDDECVGLP